MKQLLLCLICLFFAANASAFCEAPAPQFVLRMRPGTVVYNTDLSRGQFIKQAPGKVSPNTLGLTVAKMEITGKAVPFLKQQRLDACVSLKEVHLELGYGALTVYIDKKYKPGSCEYEVIKEHENYHVSVFQQAMNFFKPDVERALRSALSKVKPQVVSSQAMVDQMAQQQFQQVMREVQPMLDHINAKIAEKNYLIDTPESYRDTTALCKNW